MSKIYTDKFLISELQRFYRENDEAPTQLDMQGKFGYPSFITYISHFGSWNNALEIANLPLNQTRERRTGLEICSKCGCKKIKNKNWYTKGLAEGEVMCFNCYQKINCFSDYMSGSLDKNSNRAKATISEQVVKNVLNLEERHDCNFAYDFNYPVDLYHKDKYKYINVKDSKLYNRKNHSSFWNFNLTQKETPDTYIMLGYDENRKNILHVWVTDAIDDFVFNEKTEKLLKIKTVTNIPNSLKEAEPWKVDPKPYNDMLHKMSEKRKDNNGIGCFLSNDDLSS